MSFRWMKERDDNAMDELYMDEPVINPLNILQMSIWWMKDEDGTFSDQKQSHIKNIKNNSIE